LWDLDSGGERGTLRHPDEVFVVAFSPDGRTLASGGVQSREAREPRKGVVRLWEAFTRAHTGSLPREAVGLAQAVAWAPDGRVLATAGVTKEDLWRASVRLWDAATGKERASLKGDGRWVGSLAFSPDGRSLATGGGQIFKDTPPSGELKLWDLASGKVRFDVAGHKGYGHAVAFPPDGRGLLWASRDGPIRLWDVAGGRERACLREHTGPVHALAVRPDGKVFASGGDDGKVRLWGLPAGKLL